MMAVNISPTILARKEAREHAVYKAIVDYHRGHEYGPSYRDICDATGISSTSIALDAVKALIARGLVEKDLGVNRSIRAVGPYPRAPKCPPHRPPQSAGLIDRLSETGICRNCGQRIRLEWVAVDG